MQVYNTAQNSKVSLKSLKIVNSKVSNISMHVQTGRSSMLGPYLLYNKRIGMHMDYFEYDQKA
jgi:hypothetical protein